LCSSASPLLEQVTTRLEIGPTRTTVRAAHPPSTPSSKFEPLRAGGAERGWRRGRAAGA
jgi:hypothetical protein